MEGQGAGGSNPEGAPGPTPTTPLPPPLVDIHQVRPPSKAGTKDPPLWQSMIETAAKFINDPKVAHKPLNQRYDFLRRKGLTEDDLKVVSRLTGAEYIAPTPTDDDEAAATFGPLKHTDLHHRLSSFSAGRFLKGVLLLASIALGSAFWARNLWQVFRNWFWGQPEKRPRANDEEATDSFKSDLKGLKAGLDKLTSEIRVQIRCINEKLDSIVNKRPEDGGPAEGHPNSMTYRGLQDEIGQLKGLLLSPSRFPDHPPVRPMFQAEERKSESPVAQGMDRTLTTPAEAPLEAALQDGPESSGKDEKNEDEA